MCLTSRHHGVLLVAMHTSLSSAGVTAAVAAARQLGPGASVEIVEPWQHVGGMLSAGMVDDSTMGNTRAYGGLAAELYRRIGNLYNGTTTNQSTACFKGEPHVVEQAMRQWLKDEHITLTLGQSVHAVNVSVDGRTIVSLDLIPSNRAVAAAQYVDASYEGDLLAMASVPTALGRESITAWDESFAGQGLCANRTRDETGYEAFATKVNATGPNGTLLPGVDGSYSAPWSQDPASRRSDTRVQSYNFRACLTRAGVGKGGVPIPRPASYNPDDYTLAVQYIASLNASSHSAKGVGLSSFFGCSGYLKGKCDTNDGAAVGINPMGNETYKWASASPAQRIQLVYQFTEFTLGLWWFLGHDNRVPTEV